MGNGNKKKEYFLCKAFQIGHGKALKIDGTIYNPEINVIVDLY